LDGSAWQWHSTFIRICRAPQLRRRETEELALFKSIQQLITLTFRPVRSESPLLARGAYFRICADATLRGPDNSVAAVYANHSWLFGNRRFRCFECEGPVYLRIRTGSGSLAQSGPYGLLRESEGALYSNDNCLGVYLPGREPGSSVERWQEITLLSNGMG
jgi:hypothetical protein